MSFKKLLLTSFSLLSSIQFLNCYQKDFSKQDKKFEANQSYQTLANYQHWRNINGTQYRSTKSSLFAGFFTGLITVCTLEYLINKLKIEKEIVKKYHTQISLSAGLIATIVAYKKTKNLSKNA